MIEQILFQVTSLSVGADRRVPRVGVAYTDDGGGS
jgi:hypothetical protein